LEIGDWRLEIGDWRLGRVAHERHEGTRKKEGLGNLRLVIGDWKLEIGDREGRRELRFSAKKSGAS
jgi:hypothetical protein